MFWVDLHLLDLSQKEAARVPHLVSQQQRMDGRSVVPLLEIHCPDVEAMETLLPPKLGVGDFFSFS